MKKSISHRPLSISICLCLILCGCITEYKATGIDELSNIFVVEGVITDNETMITLSRSSKLSEVSLNNYPVTNAEVSVECDDGTQFRADRNYFYDEYSGITYMGIYVITTGQLNLDRKYRLKIEIEEIDGDCVPDPVHPCPMKIYEYSSDYSYPIKTPEIDSVFWIKKDRGQPVMIYVSTRDPENKNVHYRWSYKEDWEINSEFWVDGYPFYCWSTDNSKNLLIGSAEKTVLGQLTDKVTEISPSSRKFSVLYRIDIKQNAISKRAYDYFANIIKNSQQTGSIFAPIPSELRGNIICTTDPDKAVIGYVDVSTTTQKRRYISNREVYESPYSNCRIYTKDELCELLLGTCGNEDDIQCMENWMKQCEELQIPSSMYIKADPMDTSLYVPVRCADCTYYGKTRKPDDWPNNH